jgi:hypothetical protein
MLPLPQMQNPMAAAQAAKEAKAKEAAGGGSPTPAASSPTGDVAVPVSPPSGPITAQQKGLLMLSSNPLFTNAAMAAMAHVLTPEELNPVRVGRDCPLLYVTYPSSMEHSILGTHGRGEHAVR